MKLAAASILGIALISVPEEIQLGREANVRVRGELVEFRDASINTYIRSVGNRLVRSAPGPKYPYSFSVADYREINAFALPGGPIWINRGVLHAAGSEAQVAGVLAHEIAHIAERHAARHVTNGVFANWGLGLLSALLGNTGGASTARMAAGLMTNGIFLKFSRDDEREADRVGLQILTRAGWDGRGMVELFDVVRRERQRDPNAVDVFLSTHPSPAERIQQLRADVSRRPGGRRNTAAFGQARARSLTLSPPRRMQK
jgi:beta-barrel assembly-enhancing protease